MLTLQLPTWREDQEAAESKKSFTQATLVFGSLQLARRDDFCMQLLVFWAFGRPGYWAYNRKDWVLRLVERKSGAYS